MTESIDASPIFMETRPTSGSNEALEQGIEKGGGGSDFRIPPHLFAYCLLILKNETEKTIHLIHMQIILKSSEGELGYCIFIAKIEGRQRVGLPSAIF